MSPHAKNYLLIFLFLSTIIAGSVAWQNYSKVADLTSTVQTLSRELNQSRALAVRTVRQPAAVLNNPDLSAADPTQFGGGRGRRGAGGNGRRGAGVAGAYAGGGGG
jgi:uncharacterized membrane protein YgcG